MTGAKCWLKVINMYKTKCKAGRKSLNNRPGKKILLLTLFHYPGIFVVPQLYPFTETTFSVRQMYNCLLLVYLSLGWLECVSICTSLNDVKLSFLAMNFLRWRTVACAEQRIHLRFRPRSLLLLHSKQMLTCERKHKP